jgi:hypothetical protein
MNHFDELPRRDSNHEIEDEAIATFQMLLTQSGAFILQASDRKDYGTDCQIEVTADGHATNVRVHVQLNRLLKYPSMEAAPLRVRSFCCNLFALRNFSADSTSFSMA